jgi:hypothetical protein
LLFIGSTFAIFSVAFLSSLRSRGA